MPIELVSTESISPLISLDALLLPARLDDALRIPLHRVPDGLVSNNEVISANWDYGVNNGTPPSMTPPRVPDQLEVVSPTPDTQKGPSHDDQTVSPVTNLENAHTDLDIFKPSDLPKHSVNHVLDKIAAVMAMWDEQVNKALSQVQATPDLLAGIGNPPRTHIQDILHGTSEVKLNASPLPSSQPVQNMASTYMLLQSQIAVQKMAEASGAFLHALDKGEVSVKLIGSPDPFVPLAPPSLLASGML